VRHNDHGAQFGTRGGKGDALTMIAPRRRYHTADVWLSLFKFVHVHQAAAYFERAYGLVILVFNPNLGAGPLAGQGPTDLRCRRQNTVNKIRFCPELL